MARRVFFSFHYDKDNWRAGVVRNSWVTKPDREAAGFWDATEWEEVKNHSDRAIKRWINKQMKGTSVTAVLIGAQTYDRRWVNYEIGHSHEMRNGILGVRIHNIKNKNGFTSMRGKNPLSKWYVDTDRGRVFFTQMYSTYDWVRNNGNRNFARWVEKAARDAGR